MYPRSKKTLFDDKRYVEISRLQTGDVILLSYKGVFGRVVGQFGESPWSHVAIVFRPDKTLDLLPAHRCCCCSGESGDGDRTCGGCMTNARSLARAHPCITRRPCTRCIIDKYHDEVLMLESAFRCGADKLVDVLTDTRVSSGVRLVPLQDYLRRNKNTIERACVRRLYFDETAVQNTAMWTRAHKSAARTVAQQRASMRQMYASRVQARFVNTVVPMCVGKSYESSALSCIRVWLEPHAAGVLYRRRRRRRRSCGVGAVVRQHTGSTWVRFFDAARARQPLANNARAEAKSPHIALHRFCRERSKTRVLFVTVLLFPLRIVWFVASLLWFAMYSCLPKCARTHLANGGDRSTLFCSELVSLAYRELGFYGQQCGATLLVDDRVMPFHFSSQCSTWLPLLPAVRLGSEEVLAVAAGTPSVCVASV